MRGPERERGVSRVCPAVAAIGEMTYKREIKRAREKMDWEIHDGGGVGMAETVALPRGVDIIKTGSTICGTLSMEATSSIEKSPEELDQVERSNKKPKDMEIVVSDDEVEIDDQYPTILLSKEEKLRIQAPWRSALIIKAIRKSVGFKYMDFKIRSLWKPQGDMQIIDLGLDFFLIRLKLSDDYWNVVNGGPWFIKQQFLSVRCWSPGFCPSEAKITTIAVWIRLPELPIELYDSELLRRIGNQLGKILKIDARTADSERGRYAHICIQIDIDQPLTPIVQVGNILQNVQYEGVSAVCVECGCVGHRLTACPLKVNPNNNNGLPRTTSTPPSSPKSTKNDKLASPQTVAPKAMSLTSKNVTEIPLDMTPQSWANVLPTAPIQPLVTDMDLESSSPLSHPFDIPTTLPNIRTSNGKLASTKISKPPQHGSSSPYLTPPPPLPQSEKPELPAIPTASPNPSSHVNHSISEQLGNPHEGAHASYRRCTGELVTTMSKSVLTKGRGSDGTILRDQIPQLPLSTQFGRIIVNLSTDLAIVSPMMQLYCHRSSSESDVLHAIHESNSGRDSSRRFIPSGMQVTSTSVEILLLSCDIITLRLWFLWRLVSQLLWDSAQVQLDVLTVMNQVIHASVQVNSSNSSWLFSAIYASPSFESYLELWDHLASFAATHSLPWLVAGDFNEILSSNEKFSATPASQRRMSAFRDCLNMCNLLDLGFNGPRFTWTNKRPSGLVMEKLDRVLCNPTWKHLFEEASVLHLLRASSDHNPILVDL
uniref:CCHC-type domain-containing protein n=1 Tax=Fagus sylvatica TaxID=28930 RepID=A0A2N9HWM2_FAGSY